MDFGLTQEETGELFNLEVTPAESTSYRLAMLDKERYPEIICANEEAYQQGAAPFYTNSTQLPVNFTDDIFESLALQDELQTKYTGGTVVHIYLGECVTDTNTIRDLVRKVVSRFRLPYFTITPTFKPSSISMFVAFSNTEWIWPILRPLERNRRSLELTKEAFIRLMVPDSILIPGQSSFLFSL